MKNNILNKLLAIAMLMPTLASAHTLNGALGAGTLNSPAVDIYRLNCFNDPSGVSKSPSARARVFYYGSGTHIHRVSIVRQTPTTVGMTSVTTEGTSITRNGVNGDFYIFVSRTSNTNLSPSTYTLDYFCETSGGIITGTTDEVDMVYPASGHFIQDK